MLVAPPARPAPPAEVREFSVAVLWRSLFVDDRSWRRVENALARDRRLVIITGHRDLLAEEHAIRRRDRLRGPGAGVGLLAD